MKQPLVLSELGREILLCGASVAWVLVLSYWTFLQGMFFYSFDNWHSSSLTETSMIARTIAPLWAASFFPALAFGIAWYTVSKRKATQLFCPVQAGLAALTRAQTNAMLCISLCVLTLTNRVVPLLPMCVNGDHRSSQLLLELTRETWSRQGVLPPLELLGGIGVVAAALAGTQAWGLLPRFAASRKGLIVLVFTALVLGLLVPASGLFLRSIPSPSGLADFELDRRDPIVRGLILGDREYEREAVTFLSSYLVTHDVDGKPWTLFGIGENWSADWEEDSEPFRLCELAQLPGVELMTMTGLPLRLSDSLPHDRNPTRILELSRGEGYGRSYDPTGSSMIGDLSMEELIATVGDSDWVVAKIDFARSMVEVRIFLTGLGSAGVRRVDLAVVPYGFRRLPPGSARMRLGTVDPGVELYEPRLRLEEPGHRKAVVIKKYMPPDSVVPAQTRARCKQVWEWCYHDMWKRYEPEPFGSLPTHLSIRPRQEMKYGEFIAVLQGALEGGATTIDLP